MKYLGFMMAVVCVWLAVACSCGTSSHGELVWSDEFDYTGLPDSSRWNYDTVGNSTGWGNNELQFYTSYNSDNVYVDGAFLHIIAQKKNMGENAYTSARLTTKGKGDWLYGRIEVRAKVPGGRGAWPAIWMLPTDWSYGGWPKSGEIDVMEHVGYEKDSLFTTIHTAKYNHVMGTQVGKSVYKPDAEQSFYVYAINWTPKNIEFFIDDEKVFSFANHNKGFEEWPFNKRFHLLLNLAIGGNWGGKQGIDTSIFPVSMEVDYVRVYQLVN